MKNCLAPTTNLTVLQSLFDLSSVDSAPHLSSAESTPTNLISALKYNELTF